MRVGVPRLGDGAHSLAPSGAPTPCMRCWARPRPVCALAGGGGAASCARRPVIRNDRRRARARGPHPPTHHAYHQGPCTEPKPWGWSVVNNAKWQSWKQLGDMAGMEAMRLYVRTLEEEVVRRGGGAASWNVPHARNRRVC